jgi:hypothetical protein
VLTSGFMFFMTPEFGDNCSDQSPSIDRIEP